VYYTLPRKTITEQKAQLLVEGLRAAPRLLKSYEMLHAMKNV